MDVSAITPATGSFAEPPVAEAAPAAPSTAAGVATAPPPDPTHKSGTLLETVAKLFGKPEHPLSAGLDVSYRVSHNPSQVVTVFSDPQTGKEVAQFPAEIVIQIAEFFDKHSGVALDSSV
ncbi:MAG TPA: hypothetical protein VIG32_12255 [Candidatus Baltobacteraceae bacterium]|jgi:hypothetical protein